MPAQPPETDPALAQLYADRLVEHARSIPRLGQLENPDARAHRESRLCGSTITVELCLNEGAVTDFAQQVDASALGDAAASILASQIIGSSSEELRDLARQMQAMLTQGGPAPDGRWKELELFRSVVGYRSRYASVLLPFEAVVAALDEFEGETR